MNDVCLSRPYDYAANRKTQNVLKLWNVDKTVKLLDTNSNKQGVQLFYEYLEMSQEERDKVR